MVAMETFAVSSLFFTVLWGCNKTGTSWILVLLGNRIRNPVQETWRDGPLLQESNTNKMSNREQGLLEGTVTHAQQGGLETTVVGVISTLDLQDNVMNV